MGTRMVCLGVALALGGCATLSDDPVLSAMTPLPPPLSCAPAAPAKPSTADIAVCEALSFARAAADRHLAAAQAQLNGQQRVIGAQSASALGLAYFGFFPAHPDNTKAATLLGTAATGLRASLRPAARAEVLSGSYYALRCVHTQGEAFLGAADRDLATLAQVAAARDFAARGRMSLTQSTRASADARTALTLALEQLDQAVVAAQTAIDARAAAPARIRQTVDTIERSTSTRLRGLAPDVAALVTALKATPPATPATPPPPAGAKSEQRLGGVVTSAEMFEAAAGARNRAVILLQAAREPGKAAFEAIAACASAQ